jgi:hypothetical protein
MVTLDAAWADVLAELPPRLRADAEDLPKQLGVSERASGWSDYATLPPVLALPRFAAEPLAVPEPLLRAALQAHLRAGFVGLAADRIADGQAHNAERLTAVTAALRELWEASLRAVTGDEMAAHVQVNEGLASLERAAAAEKDAWTRAAMTVDAYVHLIAEKTAWFGIASLAMLGRVGAAHREQFAAVLRLLMLSLQTFDDAQDEAEDRALRQVSAADALGMTSAALGLASSLFAERAAARAKESGFSALAAWLEGRAAEVRQNRFPGGDATLDAFAALALLEGADPA